MEIVRSQRQKQLTGNSFYGIPVHKEFTYLGTIIDQCLKFQTELSTRKSKAKDLKKAEWILQNPKLSDQSKLETWGSMFKSKISYANEVLCYHSKNLTDWISSFYF